MPTREKVQPLMVTESSQQYSQLMRYLAHEHRMGQQVAFWADCETIEERSNVGGLIDAALAHSNQFHNGIRRLMGDHYIAGAAGKEPPIRAVEKFL